MGFECKKCGKQYKLVGAEYAHTCLKGDPPHFQFRVNAKGESSPAFQDAEGKFKRVSKEPKTDEPKEKPKKDTK